MDLVNLSFTDKRFETHEITIGNLQMGGTNPVRVPSMANTPTHNVEASVRQAIEIFDAGAELVRFTAIDEKDAYALRDIKNELVAKGYTKPIVADVHFNAQLADIAAQFVDKVRINPGNYLEKRATFTTLEFTDEVVLPEWFYGLTIERLSIEGKMSDEVKAMVEELVAVKKSLNQLERREAEIKDTLLSMMRESGERKIANDMIQITRKESYERVGLNVETLKKENPEIFEKYKKVSVVKESLTYKIL